MTPGTALTVLLALAIIPELSTSYIFTGMRQIITRNITGVELAPNKIMEIVDEQTCSASLVRLTCRSFSAFVFVLEARYEPNRTDACVYNRDSWCRFKSLFSMIKNLQKRRNHLLRFTGEDVEDPLDFRDTLNRRCSGLHHCRYRVTSDHPEALFWKPANIRIKYACIPESLVYKYCNADVNVPAGQGGYLKSPGYPLYYLGKITCGWTFRAKPGQRIILTFHDLSIREHERDGSCRDVVRIRDNGNTLYESCGTMAGVKVISNTNVVTLNLVGSSRFYPARGFFLQYQVLGCPDVEAPLGSYICNGTLQTRTFLCRSGTLFPDTGQRTRTIHCKDGQWEDNIHDLPTCIDGSSIVTDSSSSSSSSSSSATNRLSGLSEANSIESIGTNSILDQTTKIEGKTVEDAVAKTANYSIMDQAQPAMIKDADYVIDVILPSLLIALLFVGNAVVVYIIFQYRKRKTPADTRNEEIALSATVPTTNGDPQV